MGFDDFFDKPQFDYKIEKQKFIDNMDMLRDMTVQESTLYKKWFEVNQQKYLDKISKENLSFSDKIKSVINSSNRPIIIFPQATRMAVEDRTPFKKGVSRIYEDLQIKCQPIAINSGNIWPKSGKLKPNGILVVSILKEIEPGMERKYFLNILKVHQD